MTHNGDIREVLHEREEFVEMVGCGHIRSPIVGVVLWIKNKRYKWIEVSIG